MTLPLYYEFPFAVDGEKDLVENLQSDASPPGAVSYEKGYGVAYQLQLGDPGALPIGRKQMNELFYDATSNIQQYQLQGVAPWHPASDNGGVAINYPLYAQVVYNSKLYESQVLNNNVTPGADQTWRVISGATVIPGTIIDFAGSSVPTGYLNCDGTEVSQTTYADLYAAIGSLWGAASPGNFKLPNLKGIITAGSGKAFPNTSPPMLGNVGEHSGDQTHVIAIGELPNHTHNVSSGAASGVGGASRLSTGTGAAVTGGIFGFVGNAMTIVQETALVMKLIKY